MENYRFVYQLVCNVPVSLTPTEYLSTNIFTWNITEPSAYLLTNILCNKNRKYHFFKVNAYFKLKLKKFELIRKFVSSGLTHLKNWLFKFLYEFTYAVWLIFS